MALQASARRPAPGKELDPTTNSPSKEAFWAVDGDKTEAAATNQLRTDSVGDEGEGQLALDADVGLEVDLVVDTLLEELDDLGGNLGSAVVGV